MDSNKKDFYDLIILGAGPSGLTAAIYGSRALLSTLVIEKLGSGGEMAITNLIENYPGFPDTVNGFELSQKMEEQARKFGAEFELNYAEKIEKDSGTGLFIIHAEEAVYKARSVIISTGSKPKKLGIKGEENFIGHGISFCATCDAAFYRDKKVAVIGGGDSAMDEGIFLTRFASKVIIIHRRDELRAEKLLQKRAFENPKIEFIWNSVVEEVIGDNKLRKLKLRNVKDGSISNIEVDGMFLYIGFNPSTEMFEEVEKDEWGYIITDEMMRTNIEGLFAAGDCRKTPLRQISTAVGDGAVAAYTARKYIEDLK